VKLQGNLTSVGFTTTPEQILLKLSSAAAYCAILALISLALVNFAEVSFAVLIPVCIPVLIAVVIPVFIPVCMAVVIPVFMPVCIAVVIPVRIPVCMPVCIAAFVVLRVRLAVASLAAAAGLATTLRPFEADFTDALPLINDFFVMAMSDLL
jgi:hypothetical protein